jgi:hypothetical protein
MPLVEIRCPVQFSTHSSQQLYSQSTCPNSTGDHGINILAPGSDRYNVVSITRHLSNFTLLLIQFNHEGRTASLSGHRLFWTAGEPCGQSSIMKSARDLLQSGPLDRGDSVVHREPEYDNTAHLPSCDSNVQPITTVTIIQYWLWPKLPFLDEYVRRTKGKRTEQ